jgi:hypothetical protein
VRASRGAVDAGFSAERGAVLPLLFTTDVDLATLPFAVAGFVGVLGSILVVAFTDAFALVDGRAVFAALRAGALVLVFFITPLRVTEFSGKGNPPVESEWILHRIHVDDAFDRRIPHCVPPRMAHVTRGLNANRVRRRNARRSQPQPPLLATPDACGP